MVFYQHQYIDCAQRFEDAPHLLPERVEALDMFDHLFNDPSLHLYVELEPGDISYVYEYAVLHDHEGFED